MLDIINKIADKAIPILRAMKNNWVIVCIIAGAVLITIIILWLLIRLLKKIKRKKDEEREDEAINALQIDIEQTEEPAEENEDEAIKALDLDIEQIEQTVEQSKHEAIKAGQVDIEQTEEPAEENEDEAIKALVDIEQIDEPADEKDVVTAEKPKIVPKQKKDKNHNLIIKKIKKLGKKSKCVLFASCDMDSLPITLPTNVAIEIAKKKLCLLIDLDLHRNAMAKVFELESNKITLRHKAFQTTFENLWVLPANCFVEHRQIPLKLIVQNALERFDIVLINAPALVNSPDRKQIISSAQAVFLCTNENIETDKLEKLIKDSDCKLISKIKTAKEKSA